MSEILHLVEEICSFEFRASQFEHKTANYQPIQLLLGTMLVPQGSFEGSIAGFESQLHILGASSHHACMVSFI
jgi:hypothetical protein